MLVLRKTLSHGKIGSGLAFARSLELPLSVKIYGIFLLLK